MFDAVGTLLRPTPSVAEIYAEHGRGHGSRLETDEIERRFRQAFAREEEVDRLSGGSASESREVARWRAIVTSVFANVPDVEPLFTELWERFAQPATWALFSDVEPAWHELAGRGLKLVVASNFDARLHGICAALAPLDSAYAVFVSSELRHRKPSGDFYASVARRLCLHPKRLVMVGDDPENDLAGARAAGWQAFWIDRAVASSDHERLTSLRELADRLRS